MEHVIRNARLRGRDGLWQLGIDGGRIAAIAAELPAGSEETDAGGRLLTESFVDCHVHLDKCHTGAQLVEAQTEMLQEAVERTWDLKREYTIPEIVERASRAIDDGLRYGTTAVRAFADVDTIGGLAPVKGMVALRERSTSRSAPSRRRQSSATQVPRSSLPRRSSSARTSSAACPGSSSRTRTAAATSTSASRSQSASRGRSTCCATTRTTRTRAR